MDNSRIMKILEEFKNKRILVIGDLMLDKYLWGDVSRISPEAPVQIVHVGKETFAPGGASNVAANVSSLGGHASMVGIVGDDEARKTLVNELEKINIDTKGIVIDSDKPTIQKIRVMGRGQQLIRVDYEKKEHIHEKIEKSMIDFVKKNIGNVDVIVISDYAKGVVTKNITKETISIARNSSVPVIVDPKPEHREFYKNATLITPNTAEACQLAQMEEGDDEDIMKIGKKLVKDINSNILITRSEKGMSLFELDGKVTSIPAKAREVYSIIGAGDTVVAAIALAMASGASLKECAEISNVAAGIKVGKIGTASVTIDEIKRELHNL